MKPQDIILLLFFLFFLWKNNKNWTIVGGMIFIVLSIPLFAKYIFFTAEHFVYFAALYFLLAIVQCTIQLYANRH